MSRPPPPPPPPPSRPSGGRNDRFWRFMIGIVGALAVSSAIVSVAAGVRRAHPWAPKSPACFVLELEDHTRWWVCPAGKAEHA